ncbi:conserved hypothetical protein [Talaromyces stipitatus ATCC 10500]|uniref:EthD domain-containing protein n=1 Tax=Talaromyces stipitatus (strain ATCC 10500 / CBS 375.48 / QM 6759 / NRRL 1006) TaxID=441959 RepID=B8MMT1_TALSN|nr:uncharacterized protein TSTA_100790 [Talaromyces stipitatus ATCC 10500]EED13837.1 conserved hypothetical protein [Talaromyces stipitatus ATCC 10500]
MTVRALIYAYRKPGLSLEDFKTHYEEHINFLKHLSGDDFPLSHKRSYIARNVLSDGQTADNGTARNATTPATVLAGQQADFDFDAYAELIFASQESFQKFVAKVQAPEAAAQIAADEEKFLERSKLSIALLGDQKLRGPLIPMRFSAVLSFTLGLGAVVAIYQDNFDSGDVCLPDWEVCSQVQPLVNILLGISDVTHICQQLDPEALGPATVTVTDSPQASTTTTIFQTVTNPVEITSLVTRTVTQSSQAVVTNRFSSSAVQSVRVTVPATALQTIPSTAIRLSTKTVTSTQTNTATITSTKTATDLETTTVTVTATMLVFKKRDDVPGLLASYPASELRDACWCLETATVSETVALPTATRTSTVVLGTAIDVTHTITETVDATAKITGTATVDVTSVVIEVYTITATSTTTVQVASAVTFDQEVDVTATVTATVTTDATASITTTKISTVTARFTDIVTIS